MFNQWKILPILALISFIHTAKPETYNLSSWFKTPNGFKPRGMIKILQQLTYPDPPKDGIAEWVQREWLTKNGFFLTRDVWTSTSKGVHLLMVRLVHSTDKSPDETGQDVTFLVMEVVRNQQMLNPTSSFINVRLISMSYLHYLKEFHFPFKENGWQIYNPGCKIWHYKMKSEFGEHHSDCLDHVKCPHQHKNPHHFKQYKYSLS